MSPRPFDYLIGITNPAPPETNPTLEDEELEKGFSSPFRSLMSVKSENVRAGGVTVPTSFPLRQVGAVGAFGQGIKRGIVEPFTLIRGQKEPSVQIDPGLEKTAEFLGSMVGLGISFIPFSIGTGMALRGIGLAGKVSPEVLNFIKFSTAGTVQAVGTAPNVEEIPERAAFGFLAGVGIEGFMLARALRGRSGSVRPNGTVPEETLSKEIAINPTAANSPERVKFVLKELDTKVKELKTQQDRMFEQLEGFNTPFQNASIETLEKKVPIYDQIMADLTQRFTSAVRVPIVEANPGDLVDYVKTKIPGARVYPRRILGGKASEVLIHNPLDPTEHLTPSQINQWTSGLYPEGMEVFYKGKPYEFTGLPAAEGRMQIRNPSRRSNVFAPKIEDLVIPTEPRFYTPSESLNTRLRSFLGEMENRIGFVTATDVTFELRGALSGGTSTALKGIVNVDEYEVASSLKSFVSQHRTQFELVRTQNPGITDTNALTKLMAQRLGVKGLVEKEGDITRRVHIFDDTTIQIKKEAEPNNFLGLEPDKVELDPVGAIRSFEPSWKNSVLMLIEEAGLPEKEVGRLLDLYADQMGRKLDSLMDTEFRTIKETSQARFYEGCL